MENLRRYLLVSFLFILALAGGATWADEEGDFWAPTPPRLSYIDGQVSYWRQGTEEWAGTRVNLALAEGDALYAAKRSNFEVQFGSRNFVRADEDSQLTLVNQEADFIQFKVTSGLVSFDIRDMKVGDRVELDTPNAVFVIEQPGYYRVEVNSNTHFITRRGGRAVVTTADDRTLSIYPSEDIVITAGNPVQVATYAAPVPDAWDRWNNERSERTSESVSSRYLSPDVYGAEELDQHGRWRVVPEYGPVWIPYDIAPDWAPYSTGSWVWDPYYEWTWIDDAPWGWAPFHYGRWVYVDRYWAWAPGPVVRRPSYSPALVAFMIRGHDVSLRLSLGLPGMWWVSLGWGEPVLPWWGEHRYRGHPRWAGWGGPRIVNNLEVNRTTIIDVGNIRYRNANSPRAVLSVPGDKFGRERFRATAETHFRHDEFAPVRGEMPIKPGRQSLLGGAPKGIQPPRDIVTRPVVSTRTPREKTLPWKDDEASRANAPAITKPRLVTPPPRRDEDIRALPRPPFGPQVGPERTPPPSPPRLGEARGAIPPPPAAMRTPGPARDQGTTRTETKAPKPERAAPGPAQPPTASPRQTQPPVAAPPTPTRQERMPAPAEAAKREPPGRDAREDRSVYPLPGQPANQMYKGRDGESRHWDNRDNRDNRGNR